MNWLDIVLGVILAASIASGVIKGFIRAAIGTTATILGLLMALWFYDAAGSIFSEYVSSRTVSNFLGFVAVFLLVVLAGALIGRLLALLFKWAGLSWMDRTLGACFGLLRGLLIATVIVMVLTAFSVSPPPRSVVDSVIAPYVLDAGHLIARFAPRELTDGFQSSYEKIRKTWATTFEPKKTQH